MGSETKNRKIKNNPKDPGQQNEVEICTGLLNNFINLAAL